MERLGLIAGNRRFPILFAQEARKKGLHIVAVGIKGETSRALARYVNTLHWLRLRDFNKMFEVFEASGIKRVVMAGQISPYRLFSKEVARSETLKGLIDAMQDRKANTIFLAIAEQLKEHGLELIDSTTFLDGFLPAQGVLTGRKPTSKEWDDINFGMHLAKEVARLDIGQTVAVKYKAIVAVEGLEGTDNLIKRAGSLARGGITVVKVSRPSQDMRFDIPVVGLNTVKTLIKAGARCLAIEAKKTLFIDKEPSVKLADRKGLCIVAV